MRKVKLETAAGWMIWLFLCGACTLLAALLVKFGDWIFPW